MDLRKSSIKVKESLIALIVVLAGVTLGFGFNLECTWLIVVGIALAVGAVIASLTHIFSKTYREETIK